MCGFIDPAKSHYQHGKEFQWPDQSVKDFTHSDYVQYLRQALTSGQQLPECHRCWDSEQHGGKSARQKINDAVTQNRGNDLDKTWLASYFRHKTDFTSQDLIVVDIKLSNLCNFSCSMCHADDSSKIYQVWHRDQDHPVVRLLMDRNRTDLEQVRQQYADTSAHDLLRELLVLAPKQVKILGGEPLLDPHCHAVLSDLDPCLARKISLTFVTNGSVDLVDHAQSLGQYQDINYVISIDGLHHRQEWIRRGSKWLTLCENISRWQQQHPGRCLSANMTLQALNAFAMIDVALWAHENNIALGVYALSDPDFMSLSAVPPEVRSQILAHWHRIRDRHELPKDVLDLPSVFDCVVHDPRLMLDLATWLKWYDHDGTAVTAIPEYHGVLFE